MSGFDPTDPGFLADPYPAYAALRAAGHWYYHAPWDTWLLGRAADIDALGADPRLVRSLEGVIDDTALARRRAEEDWAATPLFSRYVRRNLMETNGDAHARLRGIVRDGLARLDFRALAQFVDDCVAELLGVAARRRRFDFVETVATPLPVRVIAELLGVPEADRHRLRPWSEAIVAMYEPDRSPSAAAAAERATAEFVELLRHMLDEARGGRGTALVAALGGGAQPLLDEDELIATCILLLNAGHEATVNAAGNGLHALLTHPASWSALARDSALAEDAVEEILRYDAPLHFFHRWVSEDCRLAGRDCRRGERIGFLYAAANRDDDWFDAPDEFDLGRRRARHFSFGRGAHFCLGAAVARLELRSLFRLLPQRLPGLRLDPEAEPRRRPGFTFRGYAALPVVAGGDTETGG